jgi:phospholipid/cholesterol/gamma-HCH transport system substrate-binding protein
MGSRLLREGSVGLLLLSGLLLLGGGIAWVKGLSFGNRSYNVWVDFPATVGIQTGSTVNYRGVKVGRVLEMMPESGGVRIKISVTPADLKIAADSQLTIDQVSLLGESVLNITPPRDAKPITTSSNPSDRSCDRSVILCEGSRIKGQDGVNTDSLIRSMMQLTNAYANPDFMRQLTALTTNSTKAAADVSSLSKEFASLARSLRTDLSGQEGTVQNISRAVQSIGGAAESFRGTAQEFGAVANQAQGTTTQATQALTQINELLAANRTTLVSTLDNLNATSGGLRDTVSKLSPTVDRLSNGPVIRNLEVLSTNAAVASSNLKDVSQALNSPANLTLLQQTLESARSTFQNVQKITADLDDLTGDPKIRANLKNMINGLGKLVATTEQLQKQAEYAQVLPALKAHTEQQVALANPQLLPQTVLPQTAPLAANPRLQQYVPQAQPQQAAPPAIPTPILPPQLSLTPTAPNPANKP